MICEKCFDMPQAYGTSIWMIITLGETSRNVTSHPKDHQPRLSQLPLLPQEHREVVHGLKRLRVIRPELRLAPRKSSAVQGLAWRLGMAPGGVGPQAWIRLRVPCGEGRKVNNGLVFGSDEKDVKLHFYMFVHHVNCTDNSKFKVRTIKYSQRSMG